jgi:hypothetical protein
MGPIVAGLRRKGKYGTPTYQAPICSKKNSARAQIFRLENMHILSQIPDVLGRGDCMIPELPTLMVGFVFAFLGAIVMGVF